MRKVNPSQANLPVEKILSFNNREINLVLADGQWWIAIKPVCEALGVDFKEQFKNINSDEILGQVSCEHTTVAADKKLRKMLCIPEMYVYGWMFSIRSESPGLAKFKDECYRVLYNHFHGRFSQLIEKIKIEDEMAQIDAELLKNNEQYQKLKELEERKKKIPSTLKKMDNNLLNGQIKIGFEN